jgi:hypothetical protein
MGIDFISEDSPILIRSATNTYPLSLSPLGFFSSVKKFNEALNFLASYYINEAYKRKSTPNDLVIGMMEIFACSQSDFASYGYDAELYEEPYLEEDQLANNNRDFSSFLKNAILQISKMSPQPDIFELKIFLCDKKVSESGDYSDIKNKSLKIISCDRYSVNMLMGRI